MLKNLFFTLLLCCAFVPTIFAQATFYPNGNRASKTEYAEDYSYQTRWFENGNKLLEGASRYGKRVGTWRFWYDSGSPQYIMYYDSLSTDLIKASGIGIIVRIVSYTIDGKLDRIENYSDGLPFVNSEYYANGQMREIIHYEDGAPSGGLCWYPHGGINEMFAYKRLYKEKEDTDKKIVKLAPKRIVYKKWFENGKVAINGQVDAIGNKLGTWYEYDTHGNTLQSIEN